MKKNGYEVKKYGVFIVGGIKVRILQQNTNTHLKKQLINSIMEKYMKKTIANVEYDTDTAELIYKYTYGMLGDESGFEESLYRTDGGKYFLYSNGGNSSPYPEEGIKRISALKAEEWLREKKR